MTYSKEEVLEKAKEFGKKLSEYSEEVSDDKFLEMLHKCNDIIGKQTNIDYGKSVKSQSGNNCSGC